MESRWRVWRYWIAFFALSDVSAHTHELCHHITARLACGRWGEITFWLFSGPECGDEFRAYLGTFAGPLWTYLLAWIGALWILRGRRWLGVAVVLAQFTWQRLLLAMFMNDEGWLRKALMPGARGCVVEALVLVVIAVPPLVMALRMLSREHRLRLLWPYAVVAVMAWSAFVLWNFVSVAIPLGTSWGMSRWYLIVVPSEAAIVVWLWRALDDPPWGARPVAETSQRQSHFAD